MLPWHLANDCPSTSKTTGYGTCRLCRETKVVARSPPLALMPCLAWAIRPSSTLALIASFGSALRFDRVSGGASYHIRIRLAPMARTYEYELIRHSYSYSRRSALHARPTSGPATWDHVMGSRKEKTKNRLGLW
eukprot:scaffold86741_cov38-Prasinocladus_malaysianus.AAC.1